MLNDFSHGMMSRRTLLMGAAMCDALHAFARDTTPNADAVETTAGNPGKLKICIFSKHLQWASVNDAAAIARDIGFDVVDLRFVPAGTCGQTEWRPILQRQLRWFAAPACKFQ